MLCQRASSSHSNSHSNSHSHSHLSLVLFGFGGGGGGSVYRVLVRGGGGGGRTGGRRAARGRREVEDFCVGSRQILETFRLHLMYKCWLHLIKSVVLPSKEKIETVVGHGPLKLRTVHFGDSTII
jgi:hypothetical protein